MFDANMRTLPKTIVEFRDRYGEPPRVGFVIQPVNSKYSYMITTINWMNDHIVYSQTN